MPTDPVDVILDFHGIAGPWKPLKVTGMANRIYATEDIVLRIASEHPDAVVDARTESVAAPAAFAAGIMTPRLIAFDDSGKLVNRPYSIWERVHAETLGLANLTPSQRGDLWQQVGTQISHLHSKVVSCPNPNGYLDTPVRELSLDSGLQQLVESGHADDGTVREIGLLTRDLSPIRLANVSPVVYPQRSSRNECHVPGRPTTSPPRLGRRRLGRPNTRLRGHSSGSDISGPRRIWHKPLDAIGRRP